ncbi:ribosome biogenesis protein Nop16 [Chytriomyces sp. MP71]|nr:ribosome biogenesis protein Nop16 [Chytriomyces sp. MP71]
MVRPLQRKKTKNPSRKVSRKGKKAGLDRGKRISFANVGMPLISANWDKNLTLRQNYQRMGLMANLNGKAGGEAVHERTVKTRKRRDADVADDEDGEEEDEGIDGLDNDEGFIVEYRSREDFEAMPAVSAGTVDRVDDEDGLAENKIVIDPKTQAIGQRLGLRRDTQTVAAPRGVKRSVKPLKTNVAEALIEEAAKGEAPRHTHSSAQEVEVVDALKMKYKNDFEAMARDRRLNVYQLSAGQLKRKFKKRIDALQRSSY